MPNHFIFVNVNLKMPLLMVRKILIKYFMGRWINILSKEIVIDFIAHLYIIIMHRDWKFIVGIVNPGWTNYFIMENQICACHVYSIVIYFSSTFSFHKQNCFYSDLSQLVWSVFFFMYVVCNRANIPLTTYRISLLIKCLLSTANL